MCIRDRVIPIILAFVSLAIYKKHYKLKEDAMQEIVKKLNELHAVE